MSLLEMKNVSYIKEDKIILKDISLQVEEGDFITIVGASGSGKSTMLKLFSHLISPTSGEILYRGRDMMSYDPVLLRREISYCVQSGGLFGRTAEDNLAFPYEIRGLEMDREAVAALLSKFGLGQDVLKEENRSLSGGEKQRVALARTLLLKPAVVLLDEVTSALDQENTRIVEDVIRQLNDGGTTILWITHSPEQSRRLGSKLLTVENGEIRSLEVLR
ncbi:MAG: Xenobiotic-transporting ATPase [Firmicutes bacterium]|nr:Xenobiotic-transporting ATPase [Bacillota bacterium]